MLKDGVHFGDSLCGPNPQSALRGSQTLVLDILHLVNCVVSLLAPFQLLVQKVEHCEIETPDIVSSRQVDVIMCV